LLCMIDRVTDSESPSSHWIENAARVRSSAWLAGLWPGCLVGPRRFSRRRHVRRIRLLHPPTQPALRAQLGLSIGRPRVSFDSLSPVSRILAQYARRRVQWPHLARLDSSPPDHSTRFDICSLPCVDPNACGSCLGAARVLKLPRRRRQMDVGENLLESGDLRDESCR
jgi:hypothetical protein